MGISSDFIAYSAHSSLSSNSSAKFNRWQTIETPWKVQKLYLVLETEAQIDMERMSKNELSFCGVTWHITLYYRYMLLRVPANSIEVYASLSIYILGAWVYFSSSLADFFFMGF